MKKVWMMVSLCLCLTLAILPALAENTVTTVGTATVTGTADMAVLHVGYRCENKESAQAQKEAAEVIARVEQAALEQGVEQKDIATDSLEIYPQYDYSGETSELVGYGVTHMLRVTVRDIDRLGDVLDALLLAGANQSYGITFMSSKEDEMYLQALTMAVDNAAQKADQLAIASGLWLGGISSVKEISSGGLYNGGYMNLNTFKEDAAAAGIGETIRAGEISVTAQVEVIYEIR